MAELDKMLLNNMPNRWIKQAYVQVFEFEYITFKAAVVNMFECMEISYYIYLGVPELSYIKTTRKDANRAGHSRKMRG